MNLLSKKTLSVAATTVALTVAALANTESAHAFLIYRTAGPSVPTGVNPSLAPPTVINFNGPAFDGLVPTTATPIGPGGLNGGATIQRTGNADFQGNRLRIGTAGGGPDGTSGTVSFRFDDPRGMGYFGFLLGPPSAANEVVSFFAGNSLIKSFTGPLFESVTGTGNYFNFFVTNNSEIFNRVDFTRNLASGNAFHVDNVAYQAIPTPALLPGLVAMGLGIVRKRKAEANAEATAEA